MKDAWIEIRHLYGQNIEKLSVIVECDEMYLGGKETNKHASKKVKGTQGRSTKTDGTHAMQVQGVGSPTCSQCVAVLSIIEW